MAEGKAGIFYLAYVTALLDYNVHLGAVCPASFSPN